MGPLPPQNHSNRHVHMHISAGHVTQAESRLMRMRLHSADKKDECIRAGSGETSHPQPSDLLTLMVSTLHADWQAEWVLEHFDHPFPLPEEKDMLARLTGLPRAQVRPRPTIASTFTFAAPSHCCQLPL